MSDFALKEECKEIVYFWSREEKHKREISLVHFVLALKWLKFAHQYCKKVEALKTATSILCRFAGELFALGASVVQTWRELNIHTVAAEGVKNLKVHWKV